LCVSWSSRRRRRPWCRPRGIWVRHIRSRRRRSRLEPIVCWRSGNIFFYSILKQCAMLDGIILGQLKSDNNNRLIELTDIFCTVWVLLYQCMSSLRSCFTLLFTYCKSVSVSYCEKWHISVLMVKTVVSLGKNMYQPSFKIYPSLAFTNNMNGVH